MTEEEPIAKEKTTDIAAAPATSTGETSTPIPEITKTDTADTGIVDETEKSHRPELDRHVSTVLTSSSEASSIIEHERDIPEETSEPVGEINDATAAIAERVMTAPVDHEAVATTPAVATTIEEPATTSTPATTVTPVTTSAPATKTTKTEREPGKLSKDPKRKSFGGFFQKFKRSSKPPTGTASEAIATEPKTTIVNSGATAVPTTTGAAAAVAPTTADSDSLSSSSFRRHETDLHSISSLSSSDAEESRGRTGRRAKGKRSAEVVTSDNDEDEFEEARDHFDESLAPPPTFGGQAKTSSPVRETKFSEVL